MSVPAAAATARARGDASHAALKLSAVKKSRRLTSPGFILCSFPIIVNDKPALCRALDSSRESSLIWADECRDFQGRQQVDAPTRGRRPQFAKDIG
jgi:hypothetical protein